MTDSNRGFQKIYASDGKSVIQEGWWDSKAILAILNRAAGDESGGFWAGKTVVDIGANSCGLSVELARLGARVTSVEPDPRAIERFRTAQPHLAQENLSIELFEGTLADVLEWERSFDVVLFLGLLYHFKYPQFIIHSLTTLRHKTLFISTQCTAREGLVQVNRLEELPERMRVTMTNMTGWHLSRELFRRMLADAGYTGINEGSSESANFTNTPRSITNSTYLYAERANTATAVDSMAELYRFYPR